MTPARAAAAPALRAAGRAAAPDVRVQYAVSRAGLPAPATVRRCARAAAERALAVTVRFVGAREARALNARYRGKDHATNVLTFVYDDGGLLTGDLVLCAPVLRREARAQGKSVIAHSAHLLVHGMLHLQGYDHDVDADAQRMERREAQLLASLGHPDPYTT
ncbi:MAG: rRNA maturation RNase YbeY [Betaproteobacteria bacterium]